VRANTVWGTVDNVNKKQFVSTRSGYQNGGFQVQLRDSVAHGVPNVEVWLANEGQDAYLEQLGCNETVCFDTPYPECPGGQHTAYTYVEAVTDVNGWACFGQRWGGSGLLIIQVPDNLAVCPPIYGDWVEFVTYKSTDMNADGQWNECDREMFFPFQGQNTQTALDKADFDLNGYVDNDDLAILEADIQGPGSDLHTCLHGMSSLPVCDMSGSIPGTISDLTVADYVSDTQVFLDWTAPGAQGSSGTATRYDLRYSLSPITASNFGYATRASANPTPSGPGTPQEFGVSGLDHCKTYYFALRAINSNNLEGALSNVPSGDTFCAGGHAIVKGPELRVEESNWIRTQAKVSYKTSVSGTGRLAILDVTGRHVRTLVAGAIEPGQHQVVWDLRSDSGDRVMPGVYFARFNVENVALSRTLVVLAK